MMPSSRSVFIPVATPGMGHGGHQFRAEFSVLMPLSAAPVPVPGQELLPSVAETAARLTGLLAAKGVA